MSTKVQITGVAELFNRLDRLPIELRGSAMQKGLTNVGDQIVRRARELAPFGGPRTGDKAGKKHLKDTIGRKVITYASMKFTGLVLVAGPQYPAGAHGHIIEGGRGAAGWHEGRVSGKPFMRPAFDDVSSRVTTIIENAVHEAVEKAVKSG